MVHLQGEEFQPLQVREDGLPASPSSASRSAVSKVLPRAAAVLGGCAAVALVAAAGSRKHGASVVTSSDGLRAETELTAVEAAGACAADGEDCRGAECCLTPGHQCYEKNEFWAACMDDCTAGMVLPGDKSEGEWTCTKFGKRTFDPNGPPPLTCSWAGDDCSETKFCCQEGFACVVKDEFWTSCMQVKDLVANEDIPLPKGWKGTKLGDWQAEYEIQSAAPGTPEAGTTLYCFMALMFGTEEEQLVDVMWKTKAGIFDCDDGKIFHADKSEWADWQATGMKTLENTGVFVHVWGEVQKEGAFMNHDWTIKVDADCVFFPDRVRTHLKKLHAPENQPIYIKNTEAKYTNGGFLGAIEIFSKSAVHNFLPHMKECAKKIGLTSGEDGFMKDCLDAIGVGYMIEELMMHPAPEKMMCQISEFASFHPFKDPMDWLQCYDIAMGNVEAPPLPADFQWSLPPQIQANYR